MQNRSLLLLALLLALVPALAGCGTLTPALTKTGALDAFEPITASPRDTCPTQRAVAEHNSRYDSLKSGKEVVYRAACDLAKPQKTPAEPEPKTS